MRLAAVPPSPVPAPEGWTLRPDGPGAYTASRDGRPPVRLELARVLTLPLRAAYPVGGRDLAVRVSGEEEEGTALLGPLLASLFAADPECRRVVTAPRLDDAHTIARYEKGGFRFVAEADLPDGPVALLTAESPTVGGISTALDDMPH